MFLRPLKELLIDDTGYLTACYTGLEAHILIHSSIAEDAFLAGELIKLGLQRCPMPADKDSASLSILLNDANRAMWFLKHIAKLNHRGLLRTNLADPNFVKAVSNMNVKCVGGSIRKLSETAIRMPEVMDSDIPIIDLDPCDRQFRWKKILASFGVSTSLDLKLRLKHLLRCSQSDCDDVLLITKIYQSINQLCKSQDDQSLVVQAFLRDNVLYLPDARAWVKLSPAISHFWGEDCLPFLISSIYSGHSRNVLQDIYEFIQ